MKNLYTVMAVVVLVALATYVLIFEREPIDPAKPSPGASATAAPILLLTLKKAELQKIEVDQNAPARSVVLEQKSGKWLVDGQAADLNLIDPLLNSLEYWQAANVLEPNLNPAQAGTFKLEPPELILRLYLLNGQSYSFKIGSRTPTNSGFYVSKEGDPALYLAYINIPEELIKLLEQPPLAKTAK